jgi:acyl-CoA reductase-like NAD-dependent aldehyde dehydrogenase
VREAVAKGAKVLAGGKKNEAFDSGRFYEPTLLVNVTHEMDVVKKVGCVVLCVWFVSHVKA